MTLRPPLVGVLFVSPLLVFSSKNQCYYKKSKNQPNSTPMGAKLMGVWREKKGYTHSDAIFQKSPIFCDTDQFRT